MNIQDETKDLMKLTCHKNVNNQKIVSATFNRGGGWGALLKSGTGMCHGHDQASQCALTFFDANELLLCPLPIFGMKFQLSKPKFCSPTLIFPRKSALQILLMETHVAHTCKKQTNKTKIGIQICSALRTKTKHDGKVCISAVTKMYILQFPGL